MLFFLITVELGQLIFPALGQGLTNSSSLDFHVLRLQLNYTTDFPWPLAYTWQIMEILNMHNHTTQFFIISPLLSFILVLLTTLKNTLFSNHLQLLQVASGPVNYSLI